MIHFKNPHYFTQTEHNSNFGTLWKCQSENELLDSTEGFLLKMYNFKLKTSNNLTISTPIEFK